MRLRSIPFVLVLVCLTIQSCLLMIPQIGRAQRAIKMVPGQSTYNVGDELVVYWDPSDPCIQANQSRGELSATGPYGPIGTIQLSQSELMLGYWDLGTAEQKDIGSWTVTLTIHKLEGCQSFGSTGFQVTGSTCVQTSVTVTSTASTTSLLLLHVSTTATSTTTTTITISSDLTFPQMILTVAATAAVAGVAFRIYMSQKHAVIRITERRTGGRPGLAFDVDVKSGVDREVPPS